MENTDVFDLDINNYTINELEQLTNLPNNFTETDIIQNTQNMIEENESPEYVSFFENVQEKLLLYLEDNHNDITNNTMITETQDIRNNQPRYDLLTHPNILHDNSHYVIESKVVPTSDIFSDKNPTGILNPIRRRNVIKLINIDTIFRNNYTSTSSTDYIYTFPVPLNNIISMKLSVVELPNIWYTFSNKKQNNIFSITVNNVVCPGPIPSTTYIITIPEGNYTSAEMVDAMNNYFHNTGYLNFLHFDIDPYTHKTIIRARNINDSGTDPKPYDPVDPCYSVNFNFSIDFRLPTNLNRAINKNAGWILGFRNNMYNIDKTNTHTNIIDQPTSIVYEGYLDSEGAFGSSVTQYLFLSIDDFNKNSKNSIISENDNSYLGNNILGRITITSGSNTIIIDNGIDKIFKQREYFGPVKIEKVQIKLLDKFGTVIDLNNNDYSFALEFTQLYS